MQCAEFETQVQYALDRRVDPEADDRILAHAENCGACRQALDTQRLLLEGLRFHSDPPCSPHIGHQVLDRLVAESNRRTRRRRLAIALAIAAAILVAMLPFAGGPRGDTAKATRPITKGLAIAAMATPTQRQPTMTPEEAEEFRLLIRQLVEQVSKRPLEGFESVDQVAGRSIRPLAITLHFAFDTLRRTLPGQGNAESSQPQARSLPLHAANTVS